MGKETNIEWADSTWNPWIGCTKISPACDNCYASVSTATRSLGVEWGAGQPRRRTSPANWLKPLQWNAQPFVECMECRHRCEARECGKVAHPDGFYPPVSFANTCPRCGSPTMKEVRRRVFCSSLADVFDNEVPTDWRGELFRLIAKTPNLDWLLLTKRIGNADRMTNEAIWWPSEPQRYKPLANVWLGATIANQQEADRDIPKLLATPAAVRFLSMEPLLGAVDLRLMRDAPLWGGDGPGAKCRASDRLGLHWVIVGGESGHGARPMHPDWVRSLRDQCKAAGVPFLFKQWGQWAPATVPVTPEGGMPADSDTLRLLIGEWRHGARRDLYMRKVGKKTAGRLLDGVEHNGYPR